MPGTSGSDNRFQLPEAGSPVMVWKNGRCELATDLSGSAILPGAFNPIHDGHHRPTVSAIRVNHLRCRVDQYIERAHAEPGFVCHLDAAVA